MVNLRPHIFEHTQTDQGHYFFLARRPVFGPQRQLMAYDLVHCGGAPDDELGACLAAHVDSLAAGRQVFVPATDRLISARDKMPLPPDGQQVVVVFPADIKIGDSELEAVHRMAGKGYLIALADFDYGRNHNALLPYADFVILSISGRNDTTLQQLLATLHEFRLRLIAEHVDTLTEFERVRALGFDGFMGAFYRQPRISESVELSASGVSLLRLALRVQEASLDARELERLISANGILGFQLLRYINSAAIKLRRKVDSIRHAIIMLGPDEIRRWTLLVSTAVASNKSHELIRSALWRASMCELLCGESGRGDPGTAMITGLFSLLDALFDKPLEEILSLLPVADDIRAALLLGRGEYAELLACVLAHECGDWPAVQMPPLTPARINAIYLRAVRRADRVMKGLFDTEAEAALVVAD